MSEQPNIREAHVAVRKDGAVATAELCNPSRRNAITLAMWDQLEAFALSVSADMGVRAVLIRGSGTAFSGGADITGFAAARSSGETARAYDDRLEEACLAIEAIRQPTVAMLTGPVAGAGLALALSCDLMVAADHAYLMVPAARLGLGYDPRAIARLSRRLGPAMARELMLTGGRIPAARAHTIGAINTLAPAADLAATTEELLARLVDNAPLTLTAAKVALRAAADGMEPTLFDEAWRLAELANASADYAEGRTAFAEKRPPRFEGR